MVELQESAAEFESNQIGICAISYDAPGVLAEFANRHHIKYPLLADTDSDVIRRFGILNTHIPQDHAWYGVPFPGIIMADEQGIVIDEGGRGTVQEVSAERLKATAYLSSNTVRPGQVLTFTAEIEIEKGSHIYARPLPENYLPVVLKFEEVEDVCFGEVVYPEPKWQQLGGETLPIHEGRLLLQAPIRNSRRDPFAVRARLQYQVCDERACYLPEQIEFELPLDCLNNVGK